MPQEDATFSDGCTTPEVVLRYQVFRTQPDGSVTWEEPQVATGEANVQGLRRWLDDRLVALKAQRQKLKELVDKNSGPTQN